MTCIFHFAKCSLEGRKTEYISSGEECFLFIERYFSYQISNNIVPNRERTQIKYWNGSFIKIKVIQTND